MKKLWFKLRLIASTSMPILSVMACNANSQLDKALAKIQAVTTTTVIAPTKKNKVQYGIAPTSQDLTPPSQTGFSFSFKTASVVNDKGESKVTYVVDVKPAIRGIAPKELTFIVGGFKTKTILKSRSIKLLDYAPEIINDSQLLPKSQYNDLINSMAKHKNTLSLAVIYDDRAYIQEMKVESQKSVWYYMTTKLKNIGFKYFMHATMGVWVGPFYFKNHPDKLLHGQSQNANYGMKGYPMFFYNHKSAQLGASNYHPVAGQIIEITYNHRS